MKTRLKRKEVSSSGEKLFSKQTGKFIDDFSTGKKVVQDIESIRSNSQHQVEY